MSALEQEIIERLKHLSETAKIRVLEVVKKEVDDSDNGYYDDNDMVIIDEGELSDEEWLLEMESLRQRIAAEYVLGNFPSVIEMIREIRDEES